MNYQCKYARVMSLLCINVRYIYVCVYIYFIMKVVAINIEISNDFPFS